MAGLDPRMTEGTGLTAIPALCLSSPLRLPCLLSAVIPVPAVIPAQAGIQIENSRRKGAAASVRFTLRILQPASSWPGLSRPSPS